MDDQNKNLLLATALSFAVILTWFLLFPPPEPTDPITDPNAITELAPTATPEAAAGSTGTNVASQTVAEIRVPIETDRLMGTISLTGGRLDDLQLRDYSETIEDGSDNVHILRPIGDLDPYYALYGWAPGAGLGLDDVPGANTVWTLESGSTLTQTSPITLRWENGSGLIYRRTLEVDADFMFTVTQSVENTGGATAVLAPYGIIARHGEPSDLKNFFVLHEGAIMMSDGELTELDYGDMSDFEIMPSEGARAEVQQVTSNGWIGFTDHYWMTTLVPAPGSPFKAVAKYVDARNIYQTEAVHPTQTLAPGDSVSVTSQLFAGSKEWEAISAYDAAGVDRLEDSIDWGWFFFLTKPIFIVLHWLNGVIGNMGVAIVVLTLMIKAVLFPLAYRSYASMAKMKELQPEIEKLKERTGDDRQKLQQEMMALYKKEKVNPASGCLPILLQVPIFFSLYKVIFVTLDLRHAPFFGPFQDLSAPDPTSLFNIFGLLPWPGPEAGSIMALVFIGILPLLLGISMWLQQKLNPAPTDATQAMIFAWMPWVFMFMLGSFASGLVVYWIANNIITFSQQYLIMRYQGYTPDVFGNIRSGFKRGGGDKT
ncbi:MAG: membrane protein insertase YidC [Primorskyibacter sp.]